MGEGRGEGGTVFIPREALTLDLSSFRERGGVSLETSSEGKKKEGLILWGRRRFPSADVEVGKGKTRISPRSEEGEKGGRNLLLGAIWTRLGGREVSLHVSREEEKSHSSFSFTCLLFPV